MSDQQTKVAFQVIHKSADEKRLATVVASVVTKADGSPVVDSQGDVIHIDDLETAFIDAFSDGGLRKGGEMHERVGGADIVQHFTLSKSEWGSLAKSLGVPVDLAAVMPEVGIAKIRVNDDALWAKVKSGAYPEMSLAGSGVRVPL